MTTASYREIAIAYLRFTPTSRDQLAEDFGVDADLDGLTRQKRDREILRRISAAGRVDELWKAVR